MATSRSFGEFAQRINLRAKEFAANAETAVRRAALAADTEAVLRTPVDTGRAKGNWIVAVGAPNLSPKAVGGPQAANAALEQARAAISGWKLGHGTIYITNNLAYIVPLDNGWSAQAPAGMSQFAVQAARAELKKARLLRNG